MGRRGQISIDRIVALRSSVLPIYVIVRPEGVTTADEVSEDGNDFLTTRMFGDQIAFQSIRGDYLSAEGGEICTRRYCSNNERFTVEKQDTQYAFRSHCGRYLGVSDRPPYVTLAPTLGETEAFQLFSLMMCGVNVGQQLEMLDRQGCIMVDHLLDTEELEALRQHIQEGDHPRGHELRVRDLAHRSPGLASLAAHPLVMQLARRLLSPSLQLSEMESCRTDVDFVRKELEETTWHVVHPYSGAEFPGVVDPRINITVTWFLDKLDSDNSTWAFIKAPEAGKLPQLPQLSAPEELQAVAQNAQPLLAKAGSAWICIGPYWMSNNVGAASFWKDYDAQTRYKHLSGQKEQTFRALTDAQRGAPVREELCPTVLQATYVREHVATLCRAPPFEVLEALGEPGRHLAELMRP
ncbi:unnamed protein product [Effrenium voratum]|uniref:Uncharacterized protein n=1 Tax=Effrenium voratum TaxID=2562239 RepID=A0AA36NJ77_9DINO|nr:unnamed protein product [Effrenium voratum]CAJ1404408.1 unnamed protein product [Effrenium voratum]CAJ1425120.1 unnamed protein product [Effrenium voratum]